MLGSFIYSKNLKKRKKRKSKNNNTKQKDREKRENTLLSLKKEKTDKETF